MTHRPLWVQSHVPDSIAAIICATFSYMVLKIVVQDYFGKGLSGGALVVYPPKKACALIQPSSESV